MGVPPGKALLSTSPGPSPGRAGPSLQPPPAGRPFYTSITADPILQLLAAELVVLRGVEDNTQLQTALHTLLQPDPALYLNGERRPFRGRLVVLLPPGTRINVETAAYRVTPAQLEVLQWAVGHCETKAAPRLLLAALDRLFDALRPLRPYLLLQLPLLCMALFMMAAKPPRMQKAQVA